MNFITPEHITIAMLSVGDVGARQVVVCWSSPQVESHAALGSTRVGPGRMGRSAHFWFTWLIRWPFTVP